MSLPRIEFQGSFVGLGHVERHGRDLLCYLSRGGGDAEDLAQEVWLTAWRKLPELFHGGTFRGWLFSIARHKRIDALRAMLARREHLDAEAVATMSGGE